MVRQTAVVVGATGSMGQVIVDRLVAADLDVVAVGRDEGTLAGITQRHSAARACVADVTEDAAIDAIKGALDGPVRMAVHCAGLPAISMGNVLNVALEGVAMAFEVKVGGMMRLVRAVDENLQAGSRLVAVGGHLGLEPSAHAANPGMANAALTNLMRQYALLYGARGVTAHVVAPGPTSTDRLQRSVAARAKAQNVGEEQILDGVRAESPLRAIATSEQIAWAVSLLLAPEAEVLTGATLPMDYGRRRGLP